MEEGLVLQPFCLMHRYPHKEEPALVSFSSEKEEWTQGVFLWYSDHKHLWHTQCVSTQPSWTVSSDSSLLLEIFFHLCRPSPLIHHQKKYPVRVLFCSQLSNHRMSLKLITGCLCSGPAVHIPVSFAGTWTPGQGLGPGGHWGNVSWRPACHVRFNANFSDVATRRVC